MDTTFVDDDDDDDGVVHSLHVAVMEQRVKVCGPFVRLFIAVHNCCCCSCSLYTCTTVCECGYPRLNLPICACSLFDVPFFTSHPCSVLFSSIASSLHSTPFSCSPTMPFFLRSLIHNTNLDHFIHSHRWLALSSSRTMRGNVIRVVAHSCIDRFSAP